MPRSSGQAPASSHSWRALEQRPWAAAVRPNPTSFAHSALPLAGGLITTSCSAGVHTYANMANHAEEQYAEADCSEFKYI